MMNDPLYVNESDLSTAWAKAFLQARAQGVDSISPLVVTVTPHDDPAPEIADIRHALDDRIAALKAEHQNLQEISTVANTIFPASFWNPNRPDGAELLYQRFDKAWPRIKRCRQNRRGLYFRRMTAFRPKKDGEAPVNQLKHIVETYRGGNHRRSALQASIFDPALDHNNSRQLGFPCLHQVSFAPVGDDGFAVTGYYAMQYIFDRAYGNYLGLSRLGHFIAAQLDKRLVRMTCVAATAELGTPNKSEVATLADTMSHLIRGAEGTPA